MDDYLDRDEVMGVLWSQIWKSKDNFESQKSFALAYCLVRMMGYKTKKQIREEVGE